MLPSLYASVPWMDVLTPRSSLQGVFEYIQIEEEFGIGKSDERAWRHIIGNGSRRKGLRSHPQLYLDRTGGLVVGGSQGLRHLRKRKCVRHHPLEVDLA